MMPARTSSMLAIFVFLHYFRIARATRNVVANEARHALTRRHSNRSVRVARLDERCLSWCWTFEQAQPGIRAAGTVFNELRADDEPFSVAPARPARRSRLQQ